MKKNKSKELKSDQTIKAFSVQRYKSIGDVTLDLAPDVTVIVGPNGVGKSNFVDAMLFFRDVVTHGLTHATANHGGISRLLPIGTEPKSLGVTAQLVSADGALANLVVKENAVEHSLAHLESVQDWHSYTIYPNTLRDANLFRKRSEKQLLKNGENWVSVLHSMQSTPEGQEALAQVYAALRAVMPAFDRLEIVEAGSFLIPQFVLHADAAGVATRLEPEQLSDGTLRLFGILLAAYKIPRPSLLIIEEPEQTIYPGALRLLADVFKEISSTTQVIITTHSPHLVQQFAPHQIRVATMENGTTQIRKIHPHQQEALEEGLLSLEEFMTQGGLQPDDKNSNKHQH